MLSKHQVDALYFFGMLTIPTNSEAVINLQRTLEAVLHLHELSIARFSHSKEERGNSENSENNKKKASPTPGMHQKEPETEKNLRLQSIDRESLHIEWMKIEEMMNAY